jgi:predicted small lipoprotein YifL
MKLALGLPLILLAALGACGRRGGLYADRSAPSVSPPASADAVPRFVGQWASVPGGCGDPWVIQAHHLQARGHICDFDKVEASSAGYSAAAVCSSAAGPKPSRLVFVAPNQPHISILTVSGGPFADAVALQRCPER